MKDRLALRGDLIGRVQSGLRGDRLGLLQGLSHLFQHQREQRDFLGDFLYVPIRGSQLLPDGVEQQGVSKPGACDLEHRGYDSVRTTPVSRLILGVLELKHMT